MKILALLLMLISFHSINQNLYAIVIDDRYTQEEYIEYGNQYANIVKIETDKSFGSGIMLDNNTIITSSHTIKNKKNIKVVINFIEFEPIELIFNKHFDVAIIKIKNKFIDINKIELYNQDYIDNTFTIAGIGKTGTGLTGARLMDFKKRAGHIRCTKINNGFGEAVFEQDSDLKLNACAGPGDSGGGVFFEFKLAGIITYVTAKAGDGIGDSDYGDTTGFILIKDIEEWILQNLD